MAKRQRGNYTPEEIATIKSEVIGKNLTLAEASRKFKVPSTTLHNIAKKHDFKFKVMRRSKKEKNSKFIDVTKESINPMSMTDAGEFAAAFFNKINNKENE
jgi:predicted transcriptional regulator